MKKSLLTGLLAGFAVGLIGSLLSWKLFGAGISSDFKMALLSTASSTMLGGIVFVSTYLLKEKIFYSAKRADPSVAQSDSNSDIIAKISGVILGLISLVGLITSGVSFPLFILGAIFTLIFLNIGIGIFNGKKYGFQLLTYIVVFMIAAGIMFLLNTLISSDVSLPKMTIRIFGIVSTFIGIGLYLVHNKIFNNLEY